MGADVGLGSESEEKLRDCGFRGVRGVVRSPWVMLWLEVVAGGCDEVEDDFLFWLARREDHVMMRRKDAVGGCNATPPFYAGVEGGLASETATTFLKRVPKVHVPRT